MSHQRKNCPSILQTLANNQPHQSIMKSTHLEGTDIAVLHATNWFSPVQMMRVLLEWNFAHQSTTTCVTTSHPHQTQSSCSQRLMVLHGMITQPPLWKTSQQHHWMLRSGPKIQFQIDNCASMRHLMSQITSVPTLVHTVPHPLK